MQKFRNDDDKYSFSLIVARKDINKIDKYKINLIMDFLMETKQNTSKVIHIGKEEAIIQKEIFDELVENQNISTNKKTKVKTNFSEIDNKINNFINEYIKEEEKKEGIEGEKNKKKKCQKKKHL